MLAASLIAGGKHWRYNDSNSDSEYCISIVLYYVDKLLREIITLNLIFLKNFSY